MANHWPTGHELSHQQHFSDQQVVYEMTSKNMAPHKRYKINHQELPCMAMSAACIKLKTTKYDHQIKTLTTKHTATSFFIKTNIGKYMSGPFMFIKILKYKKWPGDYKGSLSLR